MIRRFIGLTTLTLVAATLPGFWSPRPTLALSPDSVPALPAPGGTVIQVSTVAALQAAVNAVASNQTIVIAPGTYALTSTLWVNGNKTNVTLRGATNNRNDVVLVGQGMGVASSAVPFGIWAGNGVTNLTIANLTIRDIYQHPVMLNPGTQSPRLYNVRLVDGGQQLVKANPDGTGGGVDNGVVEYCVFEYTTTAPSYYTNGLDIHTGRNWVIRHNLFRRIRGPQGQLGGPAVLMWNGSSGTIVEGNTFVDNHRDISLGLVERTPNDHTGGIIRNNMIVRSPGSGGDVPIAVYDSPSTIVAHNTIWTNGQYPNAIETRFPHTTGVTVINNLADKGLQNRDGAVSSASGNVWTAASSWFANANGGDLHLTASATPAIDRGTLTTDVPVDWDGQARPIGGSVDVGADEYAGSASAVDTTAPVVSVTTPATGTTVSGTIALTAAASDNVGVSSVWFTVDGVTIGAEDTTAPYQQTWNTTSAANGTRQIRAVARDTAGNTATSAPVTVTVRNVVADTTAPTVSLTAPAAGATIRGVVTVSAAASDNVGVVSVQFTLNGVNLGSPDTTAPYAVSWNTTNAVNGSHALRAVARDAAGNVTMSAVRVVTVGNVTTAPPPPAPPPTPPTSSSGCPTPDPFAAMGGGTCYNGGWLPPGMTPPATSAPVMPPPVTSPPAPPASSAGCSTPDPFASMGGGTCYNGGWLPPGMTPPTTSAPITPPVVPTVPQTPSTPPVVSVCTSPRPGADWVCAGGGWLPPGVVPAPVVPPAVTPVPSTPGSCTTPAPGSGWTCRNGGWLPPGYPGA